MFGAVKLALAGGVFAAAVPFLSVSGGSQDPVPVAAEFYQESTWNLAVLQYTTLKGDTVEVPARLLTKVWLLKTPAGQRGSAPRAPVRDEVREQSAGSGMHVLELAV